MDFQLTDEQRLISEAAREFADREIVPRVRDNDRAARFDRELASKLGEVGYLGAPVAEEYGGRGLDYIGYGLIVEQVGRADSSARTVVSVQTSLVAGSIERWGTRGAEAAVAAAALLGRGARLLRADRARHRLRRRQPADPGDEDRLGLVDQRPEDVDLARQLLRGRADLRPDRPRARSTAASPASWSRPRARASRTQEIHGKLGLRSSDTAELSLDEVEVGDDAMLGEIGDGFKVAMSALDNGRYSVAAGCVGICDGCVEASVAYAKERKQFGVPLARFQLVQEMIADMILKRDASRMLVYRAGALKDEGKPNTMETSVAKLYATESAVECANLAIQVHGGAGYVDDYPVERYLRDARVTTLYEGTSQIQKLIIGRAATGINAMTPDGGRVTVAELVETSRRRVPRRPAAAEPARGAQRALAGDDGGARLRARAARPRPRGPLHRHRRLRRGLRRRRRHQGDERAQLRRGARHPAAAFWRRLAAIKTPLIAAVSGYALGGGCELALACDMIVASETAAFGQPEITLGIIPGGGGTQRLARVIGKQRAMEYVLTGRRFDAADGAASWASSTRSCEKGDWLQEALELARTVAERPPIAARLAKQAVLAAEETALSAGLENERRLYELAMATEDRVEGMQAFLEKREPKFEGR